MISLHSQLALSLQSVGDAPLPSTPVSFFCFDPTQGSYDETKCWNEVHLDDIDRFLKVMRQAKRNNPNKLLVACAKAAETRPLTRTVLLLGIYMIQDLELDVDAVQTAFEPVWALLESAASEKDRTTIMETWRAIHRVRQLRWFDFSGASVIHAPDRAGCELDEYLHYADPANGSVSIVVPGRLLFMPSPANLPDGCDWMDIGDTRRFSPAFFADLLASEFGAALLLKLGRRDDDAE